MTKLKLIKNFRQFISDSPTQFHVVESMTDLLRQNGFSELKEKNSWKVKKGDKHFVVRGASIIAFVVGNKSLPENGYRIVGAHTDSPGLKIKSNPEKFFREYLSLGVETYGGLILSSWFDRDLSIAGRVNLSDKNNQLHGVLVDFQRPVAIIPNLAIHLNQKKENKNSINKQTELPPLIMQVKAGDSQKKITFKEILLKELEKNSAELKGKTILDFDLWLYDTQPSALVGMQQEFLVGSRIDNLLSCFTGLTAMLEAGQQNTSILVCNDHEEVGSASNTGSAGPFLKHVLERICKNREDFLRTLSQSFLISNDNAHGVHPNYPGQHDENHGPLLNHGPVIKINANQRYATNSETGAYFRNICQKAKVPVQDYIVRSDLASGSTIGPITATNLGVKTLDIGAPTFAMHSIRETCGVEDIAYLTNALKQFFQ